MKPDRIIINSNDNEEYTKTEEYGSNLVNAIINGATNNMVNLSEIYQMNTTSKLTHSLSQFLQRPTKIRISKVSLPGSIPTFNSKNNTLKMFKKHTSDANQHAFFDIVMDTENCYNTFQEFNIAFSAKLGAENSNFSSTINGETGILTITSVDPNFSLIVIERNLKFGFLFPMMNTAPGGASFTGSKAVELNQTSKMFVRTNIETNIYNSNQSTKILSFFGYTPTINNLESGGFVYENKNENYISVQTTDIQNIEVEFLDDNLNLLDFNSLPVSIEIDLKYD